MYFSGSRKRVISIHVPREGDDLIGRMHNERITYISIHVPREGDDIQEGRYQEHTAYFNPRPP